MKMKKLLASVLAAAMSISTLTAVTTASAETEHGKYYAIYPTATGTIGGSYAHANGAKSSEYDVDTDSVHSYAPYSKSATMIYSLSEKQKAEDVNYIAVLQKYNGEVMGTNNLAWMMHDVDVGPVYSRAAMISQGEYNNAWEKTVMPVWTIFRGRTEISSVNQFTSWSGGRTIDGNSISISGQPTADNYTKYIAFFANEADANAYDLSIKSASINGINAKVDNVAHTIKFETVDKSLFAGQDIVLNSDPLATVTTTDALNYEDDLIYNVTNVLGQQLTYTVTFEYPQEEETAHGGYKVVWADTDGKYQNVSAVTGSRVTPSYNAEFGAIEGAATGWNADARVNYVLTNPIPASYKYIQFLSKYTAINTNAIAWTIYNGTNGDELAPTIFDQKASQLSWAKRTYAFPNKNNMPITTFSHFIHWKNSLPAGSSYDGNWGGASNLAKYIAFFEKEEDAGKFDFSIRKYSINGIDGDVDNINHTITFNFQGAGVDSTIFENAQPVINQDPQATITKITGDIDYEAPAYYAVTDALGNSYQYKVKFIYGDEPMPENGYLVKFDTVGKVQNAPIELYNWDENKNGEYSYDKADNYFNFDNDSKAMKVDIRHGGSLGVVYDKPIESIDEYKYAVTKYKYLNGGVSSTGENAGKCASNFSYNKTSGYGSTVRDYFEYGYFFNGGVRNDWLVSISDVSDYAKSADGNSRMRFNIAFNDKNQTLSVVALVKYIGLFKTYEDAYNFVANDEMCQDEDSESIYGDFSGVSFRRIANNTLAASADYIDDKSNVALVEAVYDANGKLVKVARADEPTYTDEFGVIKTQNSVFGKDEMYPVRQTTIDVSADLSDLPDGAYTAKAFMWSGKTLAPYTGCDDISFTVTAGKAK